MNNGPLVDGIEGKLDPTPSIDVLDPTRERLLSSSSPS